MARVFKRPGSDFYYGRFKVDGKDKWFSTKCTERKQAQDVANGKEQAARAKINTSDYFTGLMALLARLPEKEQDAQRNEFARRLMQGQSSTLPVADAWQAWLDSPEALGSNPALALYYCIEGGILRVCGSIGVKPGFSTLLLH